ncbi:hypothetical protein ACHAXR_013427 [Thalassiosira sp. AJA248-18]
MVQRRGRPLKGFADGSSSSDSDNDAFASISKRKKPRISSFGGGGNDNPPLSTADGKDDGDGNHDGDTTSSSAATGNPPAAVETSSNKRHHHVNAARQAKMDALLQELQTAKPSEPSTDRGEDYGNSLYGDNDFYGHGNFAPHKKGSYVEPGMEHLTTNLFVGNLDPMTTEEELTDAFRQFGDLYSVKIMWPRTAEERSRNRNTGFVCFMSRADAEDAMDELCDADPVGSGRRMVLRWGKNVKKTVKFGTGGVPTNLRKKPREKKQGGKGGEKSGLSIEERNRQSKPVIGIADSASQSQSSNQENNLSSSSTKPCPPGQAATSKSKEKILRPVGPIYDPSQHSADAITVVAPSDPRRLHFITTVASFVSKDGTILEQKLIETEFLNREFGFLTSRNDDTVPVSSAGDEERLAEHIFYRWRVYAFAQGDGFNSWRTDPFVMFEPHGRFWIPPPLVNTVAAQEEEEAENRREHNRQAAQEERRRLAGKKQDCITTGAQMRRTNLDKGGGVQLNEWERKVFHELLREKLCASQESICEAMAFAFDKSGAAQEISELLREALLESGNGISVDTRIARLFLWSDILFNSQQPGVRNAFQYRDAIEAMSPDVFESLGRHGGGRMTKNKLRKAVSSVLSAWVNWSVYNSTFIDELENKFEGREISVAAKLNTQLDQNDQDENETETLSKDGDDKKDLTGDIHSAAVSTTPRGTWTTAESLDAQDAKQDIDGEAIHDSSGGALDDLDGEVLDDLDGEALDDVDGEELDDIDGDVLDDAD